MGKAAERGIYDVWKSKENVMLCSCIRGTCASCTFSAAAKARQTVSKWENCGGGETTAVQATISLDMW